VKDPLPAIIRQLRQTRAAQRNEKVPKICEHHEVLFRPILLKSGRICAITGRI
jgi:hypothetical protein